MEYYYTDDERIIANTTPAFHGKNKLPLKQIRIMSDGRVTWKEFWTHDGKFTESELKETQVSVSIVSELVQLIKGLRKACEKHPLPIIDDTGSRGINLNLINEGVQSYSFPNGGGRKHPARERFDNIWSQIQRLTTN